MSQETLFQIALIYLGAAVIIVPLAHRLGLGSVLGYLIAGVLIGPSVFGLVGREGADVMHFAEFGVVLMLFVIGLELQPSVLWRLKGAILGLGGLQVLLSALGVSALALLAGLQWQAALTSGLIMAMSSTAIVLQTLQEKGRLGTPVGQRSFSILLFQDLSVIPLLALFPLLASLMPHMVVDAPSAAPTPAGSLAAAAGSSTSAGASGQGLAAGEAGHVMAQGLSLVESLPEWAQALAGLAAVALVILAGRFLVRPVFRLVARTRIQELFTGFVLFLVIGITVLMNFVGLSPALGAFVAGVVLAGSEYRHEVEGDLAPFKGLLLGVFFVSVGATLNFAQLGGDLGFIIPAVLLVMLAKAVVIFGIGSLFRYRLRENLSLALNLCQVGEFAFVLVSLASGLGLFDPLWSSRAVAIVAISMALTPLLMVLDEKVLQRLFPVDEGDKRAADEIHEENSVIIAGFDRFGNVVGRFLRANGVHATVLDDDSERVELLRRMGLRVYYGDAVRRELLAAAGIAQAKLIVIGFPEPERNLALVELVRRHWPHVKIYVRAIDRPDAYRLLEESGVRIYRETIDTSLRMGRDVLKELGQRAYRVQRASQVFLKHDERFLERLAKVRKDKGVYLNEARSAIEELEELIQNEGRGGDLERDAGWDVSSLRDEIRELYGRESEDTQAPGIQAPKHEASKPTETSSGEQKS